MIDTNKLRMLAQAALAGPDGISLSWIKLLQDFQQEASPAAISELLDRLEAAESARRDDYQNWMTALDRNAELLAKLEAAEKERDWHAERCEDAMNECDALRAKIEKMERQEPDAWADAFGEPFRKKSEIDGVASPLYALPGAQNVPKEAIAKILTEVMNIAVANGADSRSMPDEYVEVAAWLCGMPAQPAPSVPDATVLLRRAAMAMEVVGTEWRESDPTLRLDLASALAAAAQETNP